MRDKTTDGYIAVPADVYGLLRNYCGYHLAEPDPTERYRELTQAQVLYEALVAAIRRERGRALAELAETGTALARIAEMTKLSSRQMVQGLIAAHRASRADGFEQVLDVAHEEGESGPPQSTEPVSGR
jgi:hypothetical protein